MAAAGPAAAGAAAGRLGLLVDCCADQGGPQGPRPYRRLQAISVDHRARAAGPHDPARGHARAVRALSALRDRAGGREPLGRALRWRACGRRAQGRQGFAWYAGSSNPWNDPGRFADSVGSSLASTISSARPRPARAAARAAVDRRAVAVVAAAAVAGNQPRPGGGTGRIGSSR